MQVWLPIIIYGTTVALGLVLGWYFLSAKRPPKAVQAIHLLTGFGGLEVVMLVTNISRGNEALSENATIALVLLGLAVVSGLFAGIMAKPRPDVLGPALAAHAFVGGSAFLVLANWTLNALP
ncbi:hypothetical protein [Sandarakinorhabdus sp.]|jgi:hypothetical protein|uniref:hypothetical protein n=1 Tax=Sandarakinorhabdus sp. TaxID=1916663 RepID=UPI0028AC491F|nr:hypothetical protein [Sandarakinorhabdus sp.]